MKNVKKFVRILLTMAMVLAMSITTFADGNGSITIDNAVTGQTYTIYKMLDLEKNQTTDAYVYKVTDTWKDFLTTGDGSNYVTVDTNGYVTWKEGKDEATDVAAFAKAAKAYADSSQIASQASQKATGTTVTFSGLDLGYYLVDSSLGTLCSLDTANTSVTIHEKNAEPTNEKQVQEDSDNSYGGVNDADIGQTVNFRSTVKLPANSEKVTFHDKMSAGLTLDPGRIKVYTDPDMKNELNAQFYTISTNGTETDATKKCTFEVSFTQEYLNSLTQETTVYVGYSATLNKDAVVADVGNPNESWLNYGDSSETTHSTTTTYTWSFDVLKYGDGKEENVLQGAEFVLLNNNRTQVATVVSGKLTGWVNVPTASTNGTITWPANTTLTTDAQGKIDIAGLDADTYYLREIKAPAGYNKLVTDVKVEIKPTNGTTNGTLTLSRVTAKVNNQSGTELPSTGGMGTTIFYVAGSILLIAAVVLLMTKKRMNDEK